MAELTYVAGYIPRWFTCPQAVSYWVLTEPGVQ